MSKDNLVLLERCYDIMQAQILRGLLETNDIPCVLLDEYHSSVAWHMAPAIGGLRLMVYKDDEEKARILLSESMVESFPSLTKEPFLKKPYFANIILSLFGLFSGAPLVWPKKERKE